MSVLRTPLCAVLGIEVPIVQAPIGSSSSPELAAAVSGAGGLGMLSQTWFDVGVVRERLRRARALTTAPIGVNLILDFPIDDKLDACLDEGAPIVSTFWGDPGTVHDRIAAAGALHLHTVASADDARAAVDAGVDVVVAQGWEAGGHVQGTVATMALVPAVVDAVAPVPVIAAGGIGDGRGLAAVLALGAQAGWLGTRFLTATEAHTHPVYRRLVIDAAAQDATHTLCFDGGWPGAPGRALLNTTQRAWHAAGRPPAPTRPGEGDVIATDPTGHQHLRYDDLMPLPDLHGDLEAMALYAGQSTGLVHDTAPAADIITRITGQAHDILTALTALTTDN
jgi:NAD(P)H-dependent flavin oxidoreductase YrpB (nitropropane dioxygenase family)